MQIIKQKQRHLALNGSERNCMKMVGGGEPGGRHKRIKARGAGGDRFQTERGDDTNRDKRGGEADGKVADQGEAERNLAQMQAQDEHGDRGGAGDQPAREAK